MKKFVLILAFFLLPFAVRAQPDYEKLIGTWVRPDGGYTLVIKSVSDDGKMNAFYFNPNPINVSVAKAGRESDKIKLYIELQDRGYPGSNYNLTYDAATDQLTGVYHHAVLKQDFKIYFTRKTK